MNIIEILTLMLSSFSFLGSLRSELEYLSSKNTKHWWVEGEEQIYSQSQLARVNIKFHGLKPYLASCILYIHLLCFHFFYIFTTMTHHYFISVSFQFLVMSPEISYRLNIRYLLKMIHFYLFGNSFELGVVLPSHLTHKNSKKHASKEKYLLIMLMLLGSMWKHKVWRENN